MELSDAEWRVMDVVWRVGAASVRDAHDALARDTGWAYSTVKTMLTRLAEKGAVRQRKQGNVSIFEPLVSQDDARRSAVSRLLDRAFDGTIGSMFQYLFGKQKLSARDRDELRALLAADKEPPGRGGDRKRRR